MALQRDAKYPGRYRAATPGQPQGAFKNRTSPTSQDGTYLEEDWLNDWSAFMSSLLEANGITPNGLVDEVGASQYFQGMLQLRQVEPLNNDWNGFFDPKHQTQLPSPAGYPDTSGAGGTVYGADDEWSLGNYSSGAANTISADDNGVIFSLGTYKLFTFTSEQLALITDLDTIPVYLVDETGKRHFVNNATNGVNVTKTDSTTLKVELTNAIFAELGITKVWQFFVTTGVGYVQMLSPNEVEFKVRGFLLIEVEPLNNDWNGFFDPKHQTQLPSPAGYPTTIINGGTVYGADDEWSLGNYSSGAVNTISAEDNGVIFSVGTYKLFTFTSEQLALIDVNKVPVYLVDETGKRHFLTNAINGVNVTKPNLTTLKVEITSDIFAELGITKVWEFFVTDGVGYVQMLSPNEVEFKVRGFLLIENSYGTARIYPDGYIEQQGDSNSQRMNGNFTFYLPVSFNTTDYYVGLTLLNPQIDAERNSIGLKSRATGSFTFSIAEVTNSGQVWSAKGY